MLSPAAASQHHCTHPHGYGHHWAVWPAPDPKGWWHLKSFKTPAPPREEGAASSWEQFPWLGGRAASPLLSWPLRLGSLWEPAMIRAQLVKVLWGRGDQHPSSRAAASPAAPGGPRWRGAHEGRGVPSATGRFPGWERTFPEGELLEELRGGVPGMDLHRHLGSWKKW